ncbi:class I SAM-dependent methyltransferase family protein [Thermococcus sp. GR7]|uniref:tRNA (guanine(37)-N1)-methyltransferase Trm5b n=1 Tax=unclassified Thermococcus TaxID=2627626 RepID=UPI00142F5CC4|nr:MULTISPECIES: class I SAM-dependent methyltransferase family protein [unclassified Thermococcus]NJE47358.1 class I SAM-dependent methyltransferase family protein [Thermococcus sp. GR7]NJE78853.1 class I SAM-dependent methyltransferase family protein [Thermococcus sp. GR4]NJF23152.1 class I SAM-dependent methyltransferase family protein [Thermococcus sp. GR5]
MFAVKVPKREAEKTRRKLIELGVLAKSYSVKREGEFILFPVTGPVEGFEIVEAEFEKTKRRPHSYREVVEVPEEVRPLLPSSFDIIGDVAIIELPKELMPYGEDIGEAILKVHKHIKAVFAKGSKVEGEYRVRELIRLAGERRTETLHRENGIRLRLDVAKVYFSPRLATERMRIFEKTQPGEIVFDMFAGVGPYSILLAKKAKLVFACDINPWAVRYLEENRKLNKTPNVVPILGDVRKIAGKIEADRVIMNLPKFADRFLREAMLSVKDGGIVHYYGFGPEENLFSEHEAKINGIAKELGFHVEFLDERKVRPYAPRQFNIAIDFRVLK